MSKKNELLDNYTLLRLHRVQGVIRCRPLIARPTVGAQRIVEGAADEHRDYVEPITRQAAWSLLALCHADQRLSACTLNDGRDRPLYGSNTRYEAMGPGYLGLGR
ncbi:hypothetical protein [Bradyrhizobium sp. B120]|uniref:hypothetical protein n=1 Tax=Bradyrhizobium sp. B120 TaxID=3410088 RepID=UPI003B984FB4